MPVDVFRFLDSLHCVNVNLALYTNLVFNKNLREKTCRTNENNESSEVHVYNKLNEIGDPHLFIWFILEYIGGWQNNDAGNMLYTKYVEV